MLCSWWLGFFDTPFIPDWQVPECPGDFFIVLLIGWKWEEMSCGGLRADTRDTDCRQTYRHVMQPLKYKKSLTILFLKHEK